MSCEICGRNNCIPSFHSAEEQEKFDELSYDIKERCRRLIHNAINRLDGEYINDDDGERYVIKLDDALEAIDDITL